MSKRTMYRIIKGILATYTAGTEAVAARKSSKVHATILVKRAGSQIRPGEAFLLVFIALVDRGARDGIRVVGAPRLTVNVDC